MIGNIGILLAFISALLAGILFFRQASTKVTASLNIKKYALFFYHLHTLGITVSSLYLLYALITHKFQYYYVYAHSNLSLPLEYLVSAFWAGQEGTYLLWALLVALSGYILIKKEKELLSAIMPFMLLAQLFLLLFLILENPFFHLGQPPLDGMGLNPLLMDPWMVIHPPVVFVGYALLTIPFAYAAAALWKKDWNKGFLRALPWAGAGWLFLGAGILIGGAWAYRVLGWGGYWGWDPVENASLIPWLTGTALVHGLVGQKQKGLYVRSNLLLSIITYVLIISASFLTRSGVMADYSVHAFAETTLTYFIGLYLLVFLSIGLILFLWRIKLLPRGINSAGLLSRQSSFGLTLVILSVSAALVLLGTLSPVLTGLFGSPASVGESFYLQTNAPLVFILFIILAVCPILAWKNKSRSEIFSSLKLSLIILPPGLFIGYISGINTFSGLVFLAIILFALAANLLYFIKKLKRGIKYGGGYLAHMGLALMFIGILGSTVYTESRVLSLSLDQPVEALGYEFTYLGVESEGINSYLQVRVKEGDNTYITRPNIYIAGDRPMRSPGIKRSILKDLYISPLDLQMAETGEYFILAKGEVYELKNYKFTFRGFTFEQHSGSNVIEVGAQLDVEYENIVKEYTPMLRQDPTGRASIPAVLEGGETLIIDEIDADRGLVRLFIEGGDCCLQEELFVVEVKTKPLITVLILGTIMLVMGTALSVWRRFKAMEN